MEGLRFVTALELDEIEQSGGSVVVAFVATWNRRCRAFASDYHAFADAYGVELPVVCVDVDECSDLAAVHDIFSVPTILLLRAGVEQCREVGLELAPIRVLLESSGRSS